MSRCVQNRDIRRISRQTAKYVIFCDIFLPPNKDGKESHLTEHDEPGDFREGGKESGEEDGGKDCVSEHYVVVVPVWKYAPGRVTLRHQRTVIPPFIVNPNLFTILNMAPIHIACLPYG